MSPPPPPAAMNAGHSPEQVRLPYMPHNVSPQEPRMKPDEVPRARPQCQFYPQGSYSVRTGSSQSYPTVKPPEALLLQARRSNQERKRKRAEEALRHATPPHSPHMVGEVGFPSVEAASHANEGEYSKRYRTESPLGPYPTFAGNRQANESRPRQQSFPGYADVRQAVPPAPALAYMHYQQAQAPCPPYVNHPLTQVPCPPYMVNQRTQTAAPARMVDRQTQAAIPRPETLPTRVDAQMV
ncbi:unnamed protein product [Clonostachys rosea]|uniref:BZIP domain-containing protein n=1 Tax=Bionectria ochroleuca TaxID=29856 RepID=A0ABY6UL28_BIOOC|nr:unnamed protein product [Clonostachys rosea]